MGVAAGFGQLHGGACATWPLARLISYGWRFEDSAHQLPATDWGGECRRRRPDGLRCRGVMTIPSQSPTTSCTASSRRSRYGCFTDALTVTHGTMAHSDTGRLYLTVCLPFFTLTPKRVLH